MCEEPAKVGQCHVQGRADARERHLEQRAKEISDCMQASDVFRALLSGMMRVQKSTDTPGRPKEVSAEARVMNTLSIFPGLTSACRSSCR